MQRILTAVALVAAASLCTGNPALSGNPPAPAASQREGNKTPNTVIILTDNQGYAGVGCNRFYDTPALDALAKESVIFTSAYSANSVCSPTRSSILTGQYPARTRNTDYSGDPSGRAVIPEDSAETTGGNFSPYQNPNLPDGPEDEHLPPFKNPEPGNKPFVKW